MSKTLTAQDLADTFDAFNRHDIDGVMTHFADDCVFYTVAGDEKYGNKIEGSEGVVIGGVTNWGVGSSAKLQTIIGGQLNRAQATQATVIGGQTNRAKARYATVGGGYNNLASARFSAIPGGSSNTVKGKYSSALGSFNIVRGDIRSQSDVQGI